MPLQCMICKEVQAADADEAVYLTVCKSCSAKYIVVDSSCGVIVFDDKGNRIYPSDE